MERLKRNGILVKKCFNRYLLPMVLLNVGTSLSEFVDSIIVSSLLGEEALVIVNAAMPLVLCFSFAASLIGVGGSVIYANLIGERRNDEAASVYTVSVYSILILSAMLVIPIYLAADTASRLLISDLSLFSEMTRYIRAIAIFGAPYMLVTCLSNYLVAAGNPQLSSFLVIAANVVNLLMDVILIRLVGFGVEGAAYATLVGYLCACVLLLFMRKRTNLHFRKIDSDAWRMLFSSIGAGAAAGLGQLGLACKISAMNLLAARYAGLDGQIVVSLCIQTLSIVSLVIGGVLQSFLPIVATLNGEEDIKGIRLCTRHAYAVMMSVIAVVILLFELFPEQIGRIYNVTSDAAIAIERVGFRIFSVSHLFRASVLFIMYYFSSRSFKKLALSVSVLDSFLVLPIAWGMCYVWEIDGLWVSFSVASIFCLLWVILITKLIRKKSPESGKGILLLPQSETDDKVFDVTIEDSADNAVYMSDSVMRFLSSAGCGKRLSLYGSVIAEEMALYTLEQTEDTGYLDVRIKVRDGQIRIYFRNDGKPMSALNIFKEPEKGKIGHLEMLHTLADCLEYSRLLGMNSTRIILSEKE